MLNKKFERMIRWCIVSSIWVAFFGFCVSIPKILDTELMANIAKFTFPSISRWWDLLGAPAWTAILFLWFSSRSICDQKETDEKFMSSLSTIFGVSAGVGTIIVIYLVLKLADTTNVLMAMITSLISAP